MYFSKKIAALIFVLAAVFLLAIIFYKPDLENRCVTGTEEKTVRGDSLSGLIENGAEVKILLGFYDCNEVQREDIVIYSYVGNQNPLIKIIKGIPEDKFELVENNGNWNIFINGKVAVNSLGQPYVLDERGYQMLSLYEKDYRGIIPLNTYLLLGNLATGSLDSSHFGLVDKNDILGKVAF